MLQLNKKAKEAGIAAVVNMGVSPGLINLLAKQAADRMDRVDNIDIYWTVYFFASGGGVGAGLHGFQMYAGMVPQFLNGKLVEVPGGSGKEMVEFEAGVAPCAFCGHPETVTLYRHIPRVKRVTNRGGVTPTWIMDDMIASINMGFGNTESVQVKRGIFVAPRDVALRVVGSNVEKHPDEAPVFGVKLSVEGEKDNSYYRLVYEIAGKKKGEDGFVPMDYETAPPAAVGALMLLRGGVKDKGVFPPEACLDLKTFFAELSRLSPELMDLITETETTRRQFEYREA